MKLTATQLRRIIKEEVENVVREAAADFDQDSVDNFVADFGKKNAVEVARTADAHEIESWFSDNGLTPPKKVDAFRKAVMAAARG